MTLNELQNKYHSLSISSDFKSKLRAKGYLDIIQSYKNKSNVYDSEQVTISKIAEDYYKTQERIYASIKKEENRQKAIAAKECIITYATTDEISHYLLSFKPDDKSLTNYLNYLKGAGYMSRIRYEDFVSAYNLLML